MRDDKGRAEPRQGEATGGWVPRRVVDSQKARRIIKECTRVLAARRKAAAASTESEEGGLPA